MASPSLYDFISQIKGEGLSRTNRFLVNIASPAALGGSDARLIQLYCEQAALPGMAYASTPVRSFGENREVVYERNFEPIALTFYVDRKMSVLSFFNEVIGFNGLVCYIGNITSLFELLFKFSH